MLKSFLAFLGGEPGEEKPMLLLLGMGFFMGVFVSTYQIGSESLFLNELGESHLDIAFFTAGGLGIISTLLFVFLQKRINFSTLITSNMFLIFLFMGGMRAAFTLTGYEDQPDEVFKILPFIMFVMMGPITAITLLGFWGLFGRMFDLRASKRIIGGIDTGALTSTIIAFFSIPFIVRLPFINETYDLLFVSAIASFGVLIFTIWIVVSFNVDKATKSNRTETLVKEVSFWDLIKDPYLRLMTFFLMFSMGASVFVDYTFYSATEIMYPDEQELTNFLSFFSGTVMLMSFVIQSFINDIIIGRFGLKVALMTMPIILILFTIGGIISGHFFGYEEKTDVFILFFMFTVTAKAFTASLKDALESPAYKLFFLPIDIKIRFDIQTRIEGVASELATLIAGAVQIGLGLLAYFKLIHFSYFILGLAAMVVWLAGKLFNQYKVYLKQTLEIQKQGLKGNGKKNEENTLNILKRETRSKDTTEVINGLRLLESIDPIQFENLLLDLIGHKRPVIRTYAYNKLKEYLSFQALDIILKEFETEGDEQTVEAAKQCIDELQKAADFHLNDISLRELIRSTDSKDRIKGAKLLAKSTEDKYLPYVLELLRDINTEVRAAAMITSGKLKRPELLSLLVENMHHPTYANIAMSALGNVGENVFHIIDTSFYKTGQYKETMVRIVQLMGRIGGRSATDLLWKKIDYPDKAIVSQILLSFSYIGLQAGDFQSARIKIIIESEIGDIAWNLKAVQDIPQNGQELDDLIIEAFREEDRQNYDNIFMLLSMIYDPQNVLLVKENIQDGTTDSITFAVEMLDIFVEEELKPKVIPILDE
ncbi:MAG: HEAT repeat domain-containing protein, partial [Cyclobacteriaceae bacterium]